MADVSIRTGTTGDVPAIVDLIETCLGDEASAPPRTEAYWRWKHEANPFGASPVLVAKSDTGRIVGVRAFLRWQWETGGKRVPAVRAVDTVTHPDWRGQGIFTRLTMRLVEQMEEEGVAFVFNTPNDNSRPGYLKMGWTGVGRVSFWLRPLRPLRALKALLFSGAAPTRAPAWLAGCFEEAKALFDEPMPEGLAGSRRADTRYATPRDLEYLRWRYASVPGFEYRAAWDFDGTDGAALIFRARSRSGLRELRLCEVLVGATERSVKIGRALTRRVARTVPADYIVAMAAGATPERRVLPWAGFLPVPYAGPHLTVRPLNTPAARPPATARASWRLGIGDLEVF